jgi:hypothetical protein
MIDAPMHFDLEQELLKNGSRQQDLWGYNYWPDEFGAEDFIEFDSMINIRPRSNNMSRYIEDSATRQRVREIAEEVVSE